MNHGEPFVIPCMIHGYLHQRTPDSWVRQTPHSVVMDHLSCYEIDATPQDVIEDLFDPQVDLSELPLG